MHPTTITGLILNLTFKFIPKSNLFIQMKPTLQTQFKVAFGTKRGLEVQFNRIDSYINDFKLRNSYAFKQMGVFRLQEFDHGG